LVIDPCQPKELVWTPKSIQIRDTNIYLNW
jgi:hypothetical protein